MSYVLNLQSIDAGQAQKSAPASPLSQLVCGFPSVGSWVLC